MFNIPLFRSKPKPPSGLWTREEAIAEIDRRYDTKKMYEDVVEHLVTELMAMKHRPYCRKNLEKAMPNYGSECTCDSEELGIT